MELDIKHTSKAKSFLKLRLKKKGQRTLLTAGSSQEHFSVCHKNFGHEETDTYSVFRQKQVHQLLSKEMLRTSQEVAIFESRHPRQDSSTGVIEP